MKKVNWLSWILLLAAITIISCEKDEKDPEELIVGKWEVKTRKIEVYIDDEKISEITDFYRQNEFVIEFFDNGSGEDYENGVLNSEFTWSMVGNKMTMIYPASQQYIDVEFTVDKNVLTWSFSETVTEENVTTKYVMIYTAERMK